MSSAVALPMASAGSYNGIDFEFENFYDEGNNDTYDSEASQLDATNLTATATTTSSESVIDIEFELPLLYSICVFGFFGNILVCMVYTKAKFRRSNAALYILNLAATDIFTLVVVLFHITEFYPSTWPILWAYNPQCQVHRCARFVGFNSTVFSMMTIAIDRFFAVRYPISFKAKFTIARTKAIIVVTWFFAIIAAIPVAFMFESIYSGADEAVTYTGKLPWACKAITPFGLWWKDFKPAYLNIFLFYLPAIITSVIYVRIVIHVRRSSQYLRNSITNGGAVPQHLRNSHWKTGKSLLYVFVVFIVCFAPFATYNVVQQYFSAALHPELKNLSLLLPYVNSCLNPVVYSFTNETFWKSVKQILGVTRSKSSTGRMSGHSSGILVLGVNGHDGGGGGSLSVPTISARNRERCDLPADEVDAMGIAFSFDKNTVEVDFSPVLNPPSSPHLLEMNDVNGEYDATISKSDMR